MNTQAEADSARVRKKVHSFLWESKPLQVLHA